MTIHPTTVTHAAAAADLARQAQLERARVELAAQGRRAQAATSAVEAAGIGAAPVEDKKTEEREGDGRQAWVAAVPGSTKHAEADENTPDDAEQSRSRIDLEA